jgi:hypothetical protein
MGSIGGFVFRTTLGASLSIPRTANCEWRVEARALDRRFALRHSLIALPT